MQCVHTSSKVHRCAFTTARTRHDTCTLCSCWVQVQVLFLSLIVSKLQVSEWLVKRLVSHQVLCVKSGDVQVPFQQVALGVGRGCLLQPLWQLMQAVIQAQPWSLPPLCSSKVLSQAVCLLISSCNVYCLLFQSTTSRLKHLMTITSGVCMMPLQCRAATQKLQLPNNPNTTMVLPTQQWY